MSISGLLRTAIGTFGFFVLTTPVVLAAPPAGATAEPTVATQSPTDSPLVPDEAQNCRYKPLPGSRIKVHVCTSPEKAEYRMGRRVRTIAVAIGPTGTPSAAPMSPMPPQAQ